MQIYQHNIYMDKMICTHLISKLFSKISRFKIVFHKAKNRHSREPRTHSFQLNGKEIHNKNLSKTQKHLKFGQWGGNLGERAGKYYITYSQLDHLYVNKQYNWTKYYSWIEWQWSKAIVQNSKWDFCPTDKRLESQIISVDSNLKKRKTQASIYAFSVL